MKPTFPLIPVNSNLENSSGQKDIFFHLIAACEYQREEVKNPAFALVFRGYDLENYKLEELAKLAFMATTDNMELCNVKSKFAHGAVEIMAKLIHQVIVNKLTQKTHAQ